MKDQEARLLWSWIMRGEQYWFYRGLWSCTEASGDCAIGNCVCLTFVCGCIYSPEFNLVCFVQSHTCHLTLCVTIHRKQGVYRYQGHKSHIPQISYPSTLAPEMAANSPVQQTMKMTKAHWNNKNILSFAASGSKTPPSCQPTVFFVCCLMAYYAVPLQVVSCPMIGWTV